jgi:hypothetical protein
MNDRDARELCLRTVGILAQRMRVLQFCILVTAIAIASFVFIAMRGLPVPALGAAGVAALLGIVTLRLLMHLGFDARVFADWAAADCTVAESIVTFDRNMVAHFNMPDHKAGRPLPQRVAGVLRLLRLTLIVSGAQLLLLLAAWLLIRFP